MSIAKVTEIIASSPDGFKEAVEAGIARANETLKNVQGAWVSDKKVTVKQGKISEWRVTLRVTFILDDD